MSEEAPTKSYKSIEKLRAIGSVESTLESLANYYDYAKTNSYLARFGLSALEFSWTTTTSTANYISSFGPVAKVWEPTKRIAEDKVEKLDEMVCTMLDKMSISDIESVAKQKLSSPGKALSFGLDVSKTVAAKGFGVLQNTISNIPLVKEVVPISLLSAKERFLVGWNKLPGFNLIYSTPTEKVLRKRKRDEYDSQCSEYDSEENYIEEMLKVEQEYDSAEDPDYDPTKDEEAVSDSESSAEDDEDDLKDAKEFLAENQKNNEDEISGTDSSGKRNKDSFEETKKAEPVGDSCTTEKSDVKIQLDTNSREKSGKSELTKLNGNVAIMKDENTENNRKNQAA